MAKRPSGKASRASKSAPAKAARKAPEVKAKPASPPPPPVEPPKKAEAPKKKGAAARNKPLDPAPAPAPTQATLSLSETPSPEPVLPPEAVLAASAEVAIEAGPSAPDERLTPEESEALAVETTLLEEAAGEGREAEARAVLEEVLGERETAGPSALVGPSDLFFTAASPGAEPERMGSRMSGLFSLAKEIAFQTLTSERLNRTVVSAKGLVGAALTGLGVGRSTSLDEYGKDS